MGMKDLVEELKGVGVRAYAAPVDQSNEAAFNSVR